MTDPMTLSLAQMILGALSGVLVGFTLGLVGGGGSVAIGTAALAVAANAAVGLTNHARAGNVRWPCGLTFAGAGIVGAFAGSTLGKSFDGAKLLFLFALLMVVIAVIMLRKRGQIGDPAVRISRENAPRLLGYGLGGGFLIVPGIVAATGMPMINAVGTSLVAVTAFGFTTAANYAWSGLVDWQLAGLFIAGGALGSWLGLKGAQRLSARTGRLNTLFALLVLVVAAYMLYHSAGAMLG
jgi:uncharacterized protein